MSRASSYTVNLLLTIEGRRISLLNECKTSSPVCTRNSALNDDFFLNCLFGIALNLGSEPSNIESIACTRTVGLQ